MAFTPIETQEQLDAIVGERVARAKEAARKEFEGWISPDELTKKTADLNTQLGSLNDQIKTLTGEKTELEGKISEKDSLIAKYETDSVKTKVASEFGFSLDAREFLNGSTEEEIRKSAEALKGLVGKASTPPAFNPDPAPSGNPGDAGMKQMLKELDDQL